MNSLVSRQPGPFERVGNTGLDEACGSRFSRLLFFPTFWFLVFATDTEPLLSELSGSPARGSDLNEVDGSPTDRPAPPNAPLALLIGRLSPQVLLEGLVGSPMGSSSVGSQESRKRSSSSSTLRLAPSRRVSVSRQLKRRCTSPLHLPCLQARRISGKVSDPLPSLSMALKRNSTEP